MVSTHSYKLRVARETDHATMAINGPGVDIAAVLVDGLRSTNLLDQCFRR